MSLVLTRHSLPVVQIPNQHTWPLRVTATSTTDGLPPEIFVYHVGQKEQILGGIPGDRFECVASVHQLNEIGKKPLDVDDKAQIPYFRSAELCFDCRSEAEAADLWAKIQDDVQDLVSNFAARSLLVVEETATFNA